MRTWRLARNVSCWPRKACATRRSRAVKPWRRIAKRVAACVRRRTKRARSRARNSCVRATMARACRPPILASTRFDACARPPQADPIAHDVTTPRFSLRKNSNFFLLTRNTFKIVSECMREWTVSKRRLVHAHERREHALLVSMLARVLGHQLQSVRCDGRVRNVSVRERWHVSARQQQPDLCVRIRLLWHSMLDM